MEIEAGLTLVAALEPGSGYAEELRLQALIAAEHGRAETDWVAIADRYGELEALTGSAIVRLNRAVAVAEADGPRRGLAIMAGLDDALPNNHRVAAVRAELARRVGNTDLAIASYRRALALCVNDVEHAHLQTQLGRLSDG